MKFYSIKNRLTAIYTFIIVFIIIGISVSIEVLSSNAMIDKSVLSAKRELRLLDEKLSLFAETLETESLYLLQMQDNDFFKDSAQMFSYSSGILSYLQDYIFVQPTLESILFYDTYGNVMFSDNKSDILTTFDPDVTYIEDFMNSDINTKWIDFHYFHSPRSYQKQIWGCSFLRKVYSYEGDFLGVFELNISEASLQSLYDVTIADDYIFYILDKNNQIVSAKDKDQLHMTLQELQAEYPPTDNRSFFHFPSEYLYTTYTNEMLDWTVVSMLPMTVIIQETSKLLISIIFVGLLAILMAFLLLNSITAFITRPLIDLTFTVGKIADGDYTIRADTRIPNEIGQLAEQINVMANNTQKLLTTIEEESTLKRQFELSYIQLQMTPHFLYNTLETICGMIAVDEKKKAIQMIQTLSSFYRKILTKGTPVVTLAQDVEITRCYLNILQQRYCEIYTYEIHIDKQAEMYRFPKLTLQPFVENALIHGILPSGEKGHLIISATYKGAKLIICIQDNGKGMEENILKKLRETLEQKNCSYDAESGFGIAKTLHRLSLFLNEPDINIHIDSAPKQGTSVYILLPAEQKNFSDRKDECYV